MKDGWTRPCMTSAMAGYSVDDKEDKLCEAFALLAKLGNLLGVGPLNKHPGCWEFKIDEHWTIAINGHKEPTMCFSGSELMPFHCYVEYNGWPAGVFSPFGGIIAAGSCANENTFIEAVEKRITSVTTDERS